jgi:acyl-CoA thioesterase-1
LVPVINLKRHNERLPRVLLIGDSISFGYSEPVAKKLSQKAVVYRINGRVKSTVTGSLVLDTRSGLQNLDRWLTQKWDVIHFNWGLHDLKLDKIGQRQVPIEEYEHNLEALVTKLKGSGARLIWATTTPVPEKIAGTVRRWKDETPYNETALRVMQKHGIVIDDLHAVASRGIAAEKPGKLQGVANVHFTPRGSELLADAVAAQIDSMLAVPPSPLQPSQGPPSPVQPLGVR